MVFISCRVMWLCPAQFFVLHVKSLFGAHSTIKMPWTKLSFRKLCVFFLLIIGKHLSLVHSITFLTPHSQKPLISLLISSCEVWSSYSSCCGSFELTNTVVGYKIHNFLHPSGIVELIHLLLLTALPIPFPSTVEQFLS